MRAFLAAVVLTLALPSVAHAAPFTPDSYRIDILAIAFDSSGADTFCSQCNDADPTNDVTGTLTGGFLEGNFNFCCANIGAFNLDLSGPATAPFHGVSEQAVVDVRLTLWDLINPESGFFDPNPEYPLPSVSYGQLSGFVRFSGSPDAIYLDCCTGPIIDGVAVGNENLSPRFVDTLPGFSNQWVGVYLTGYPVEYTPVPEPTTLLLLGGGLIGAEWKRRRRSR